ncbi:MAG: hypothetical protein WC531_00520 [Candidatus Paceibacterota bacterium]|jgi:hypothetical protein
MSKNIKELFNLLGPNDLPADLAGLTLARLEREQKKRARRNLLIFGAVDIFSVVGLVTAGLSLVNLLASSSFYNYLSLLWSDSGTLALYWQELLLSLVESLPFLGLTVFLAIILVMLISLAKTLTNFKLFYYQFN